VSKPIRLPDSYIVNTLDFYNPPRDSLSYRPISYTRDKHPQLLLFGALAERGRRLGESILNYPPPDGWKPGDKLYETQIELGPCHEVLVTTRPPLDDKSFGEPKQVLRGYTEIEWRVMQALRPYFEHLSRSQVRLAPDVAAKLRPGFEHHANAVIFQRVCAYYKEFLLAPRKQREPKKKATPAFLLRKPGFTPDGATLIAAFAMDGTMALIWSYLLARVHTDWLFEPGFRMVELSGPELPERPTDLRFALDWKAEEIVHISA
jgi:hypothetical protein